MELLFLGTGGGRFTTIKQLRKTGGMILSGEDFQMHIDPGPGALVNAIENKVNYEKLEYLLVTHGHTDHANDVKAIIEAMTQGRTKKRGILIASPSVLKGYKDNNVKIEPWVSEYHLNSLEQIVEFQDKEKIQTNHFEIEFLKVKHNDPETYGFKMQEKSVGNGEKIGFITDTKIFPELFEFFSDCPNLIINVLRPHGNQWKGHMNIEDVKEIIEKVNPKVCVLQHFGMASIYRSLYKEEKWLRGNLKSDAKVIFAKDYQKISFREQDKKGGLLSFVRR